MLHSPPCQSYTESAAFLYPNARAKNYRSSAPQASWWRTTILRETLRPAQDLETTQQLAPAGQLLGIPLRDHFIVTKTEHFSFAQHHLY